MQLTFDKHDTASAFVLSRCNAIQLYYMDTQFRLHTELHASLPEPITVVAQLWDSIMILPVVFDPLFIFISIIWGLWFWLLAKSITEM